MQSNISKSVGFVEAFKLFWLNYFNFKGRSRRSEFWFMILWLAIFQIVLSAIDFVCGFNRSFQLKSFGLGNAFTVATYIPFFALTVRRFHDVNKSMLIPTLYFVLDIIDTTMTLFNLLQGDIGSIISACISVLLAVLIVYIFIVSLLDGTNGPNRYGEEPVGKKYRGAIQKTSVPK